MPEGAGRSLAIRHFIGGRFVASASEETVTSHNPATGEVVATAPSGGAEDVDRAVRAARAAFEEGPWPRMDAAERRRVLYRIAEGIDAERDELARLETRDAGKPIRESAAEDVPRAAYQFRFFADLAANASSEMFPRTAAGLLTYVLRKPAGVAALITPWNFPLMLAAWKVAPALACGCCAVLKPAEQSPATAFRLAEICAAAGLPEGVLNVVFGSGPEAAGEALTRHPGVDVISFTGETATGRAVMANAAPTLKKVSFELGGSSPNIVFADADLDAALQGSLNAIFHNQGEMCLAGRRLLVQRPVYEEFLARFVEAAEALRVGDPLDPETEVGALITREHLERVLGSVQAGMAERAKLLTGGRRLEGPEFEQGNFMRPTVLTDVNPSMGLWREEIFGPVLVCAPFDAPDEAIRLANTSRYGLVGMVWSRDLATAHRVAAALDAGTVWVNCFGVRELAAPFGGMKDSGVGREGGAASLDLYSEAQSVVVRLGVPGGPRGDRPLSISGE